MRTTTTIAAIAAATTLLLAGCGGEEAADSEASSSLSMSDPWVKSADDGMTAAFGELANDGDDDVTVVAVTSPASPMIELHETVDDGSGEMTMREIEGGFVIPAGESMTLEPGGNHIMLMDLTGPIAAGDEVTFTLELSDGSTLDVEAPAKDYAGANENYEEGETDHDMGDMS
ncbi:hypothetical protein BHE97_02860 [Aeromicrobium sp. PE09-221]|uniref:copper chaperone PCu(A)C n=1 Tax=Aeromicrobium sp. PE09-221 TaxID=1898043 RepID=UPI000B3EC09C|nr:copper chaperone PCu(A)C [Aeromicrobium sp. PE09-221]OUZ12147.1 hypothetical protein BHE97_02860 [Aeromicrobium sp. PE09-221]